MKQNRRSVLPRLLSFGLAVLLVVMSVTMWSMAAAANDSFTAKPSQIDLDKYQTMKEMLDKQTKGIHKDEYSENDEVIFIVEMSEEPLAERLTEKVTFADYIKTAESKTALNKITAEQNSALSVINRGYRDKMEVLFRYDTVFNGFSVRTTYGNKNLLEALPGVKSVTVAVNYEYMAPENGYSSLPTTSGEMLNSDAANELGYTGKGTVTAILDTGLDTDHEAFKKAPDEPRLTLEDITNAVSDGLSAGGVEAKDLYKSEKIPFAFDYANNDADVKGGVEHGTHVAGTVGADIDKFKGVAPDTQLVIMKVFRDDGLSSSAAIIAALEDAVKLGVDSINMSLGSPAGFTNVDFDTTTTAAYKNVEAAGISLMCSAGNNYSGTFYSIDGSDLAFLKNPDTGVVGAPGTYAAAVSVASVDESTVKTPYFLAGGKHINYFEIPATDDLAWVKLEGTYDFVVIGGVGNELDYEKAGNVEGKIVLIQRGGSNFTEKEAEAQKHGAKAAIVYNNVHSDEPVYMQTEGKLPMIFITKEDGEYLTSLLEKKISISYKYVDIETSETGGEMSDFSSLGVAPDLTLKPEITAPGGSIWSTLPNNTYGSMDGTSMASPHMAGAASVVRQYVNDNFANLNLTKAEARDLINSLLLSTARQVVDPEGVQYSPRKQGAGLADVLAAINANAYLTVPGDTRPQAELGYNVDGKFEFTFTVHNLSAEAKNYTVSVIPLTAKIETIDKVDHISELSRVLGSDEITVTVDKTNVTVNGSGEATVKVTMELTAKGKENLEKFVNGTFIDGFVVLNSTDENGVDLSMPFLGFYGDWAEVPVFDSTVYDDEPAEMYDSEFYLLNSEYSGLPLGRNLFIFDEEEENMIDDYESAKCAIGLFAYYGGYRAIPVTGLLRSVDMLMYSLSQDGESLGTLGGYYNVSKSYFNTTYSQVLYDLPAYSMGFSPVIYQGGIPYIFDDGQYSYDLTAAVSGTEDGTQTLSYPIYVDTTEPEIVSTEFFTNDEDVPCIRVKVRDNHFVMGVQLISSDGEYAYSDSYTDEDITTAGSEYTFEIPLDYAQFAAAITGDNMFCIVADDYALNEAVSSPMFVDGTEGVVRINNRNITASVGTSPMTIGAYVLPQTLPDMNIEWSAEPADMIKFEDKGYNPVSGLYEIQITDFLKAGTVKLIAKCGDSTDETEILISDAPQKPTTEWDGIIHYSGTYYLPEGWNKDIKVLLDLNNEGIEPYVTIVGGEDNSVENPYAINIDVSVDPDVLAEYEGATIALRDISLKAGAQSAIKFNGKGYTLNIENDVNIEVTNDGAGIEVPYNSELTITNTGLRDKLTINMHGDDKKLRPCNGAGIGVALNGSAKRDSTDYIAGKITIDMKNSGSIDFDSYFSAAACIGGCNYGIASDITINGGIISMNIAKSTDPNNFMSKSMGTAGIGSGSSVGSKGNFASNKQNITINGGTIIGTTEDSGALIGNAYVVSAYSPFYTTEIVINGGNLKLTSTAATNYAGAVIGSGLSMPGVDVTINAGYVYAEQKNATTAAAIGAGGNSPWASPLSAGSVTIEGGTVTAVVPADSTASAIGAAPNRTTAAVKIENASVKARAGASDDPSVTSPVTNSDDETVYEVIIPIKEDVIINNLVLDGESVSFSGPHPDDTNLYPWFGVGEHTVAAQDTENHWYYFVVEVKEDGTSTVTSAYKFGLFFYNARPEDAEKYDLIDEDKETGRRWYELKELVLEGESASVTMVPDDGYIFPDPAQVDVVVDGFSIQDYKYDPKTGTITVDSISGNTYVDVHATVDKSELEALLQIASALKAEDYEQNEDWNAFLVEYAYAWGVYADPDASLEEVEGAYKLLKNAMDRLKKLHDTTALEEAIETAESLTEEYYTEDSWADLETELADALAVLKDEEASQSEINAATAALNAAIEALVSNADKTELEKLIKDAEALTEDDYTSDTWAALESALADAESVDADEDAIQPEVDAAAKALKDAIAALVERGDKTELEELIEEAEALKEANYTSETWADLAEALEDAKAVFEDKDATQDEVDAAAKALEDAVAALVERGDKTELEELIEEAEALKEADYTSETWADLAEALEDAKAVSDDKDATQDEVDAAAKALEDAVAALVERGDKTELEELIDDAEALKEADYTSETWADLAEALEEAKAVSEDKDALQSEVDAAAEALEDAVAALVKRGDKTELEKLLDDSNDLKKDDYTPETWAALEKALADAKAVSEDKDALQSEIDEVVSSLKGAVSALKETDPSAPPQTGDDTSMVLYVTMLAVSAVSITWIAVSKKRTVKGR